CYFTGAAQVVDFTPYHYDNGIGREDSYAGCLYLTTLDCFYNNNVFKDCSNGVTSHPGIVGFQAIGNSGTAEVGVFSRAKTAIISNNNMVVTRSGVTVAAFHDDTLISGNVIQQSGTGAFDAIS